MLESLESLGKGNFSHYYWNCNDTHHLRNYWPTKAKNFPESHVFSMWQWDVSEVPSLESLTIYFMKQQPGNKKFKNIIKSPLVIFMLIYIGKYILCTGN
jgi:hypothetical protein